MPELKRRMRKLKRHRDFNWLIVCILGTIALPFWWTSLWLSALWLLIIAIMPFLVCMSGKVVDLIPATLIATVFVLLFVRPGHQEARGKCWYRAATICAFLLTSLFPVPLFPQRISSAALISSAAWSGAILWGAVLLIVHLRGHLSKRQLGLLAVLFIGTLTIFIWHFGNRIEGFFD